MNKPSHGALALLLILSFLLIQLSNISYGTWINDLPHLGSTPSLSSTASANLQRDAIVSQDNALNETPATWALRYKLYAVTADEMVNLMALSRFDPTNFQFDPHFYMYGGAYLYPLAAWYGLAYVFGLIPLPNLELLLQDPNLVDNLYIFGRAFVLITFSLSAWIMFKTFRLLVPAPASLALLAMYLFVPGSLMFSIAMKPHWYALLWAAVTLYFTVRLLITKIRSPWHLIILGTTLGLAVGSTTSYGLLALIIYGALLLAWRHRILPFRDLILIPTLAIMVFFATNPFIILNYPAYQQESAALAAWYSTTGTVTDTLAFLRNSLVAGFGVPALLTLAAIIWALVHWQSTYRTGLAASLLAIVIFIGIITSTVSYWNNAYRFIPFFLPLALLLVGRLYPTKYLILAAALTFLTALPTITSFQDEQHLQHSTRRQAAAWIEANIPPNSHICAQMVPYNSAPFNFTNYRLRSSCDYAVRVHPHTTTHPSESVIASFIPRLYSTHFPLVHGEIQPRIYITTP